MLQTEILRDLIDLMEEYGRLFKASESPRQSTTEFYDTVSASSPFIAMQKKYGLGTEEVHRIITCMHLVRPTQKCLSEILKIVENGKVKGPVMPVEEKASNAFSSWAHNKAAVYAENAVYEESLFKKGLCHGQQLAYHDAACMFDVLTTRSKHLPPEIKPFLEEEGVL